MENPPKRPAYAASPKGNTYDRAAAPSNDQLVKLESEIGDIKKMLASQMAKSSSKELLGVDSVSHISASMGSLNEQNEEEVRRYISQQKQIIKKTQEKLEQSKREYKADKQKYLNEDFKNSNPQEYLK